MEIYVVAYEDYDGSDSVGYFTDINKANECCKYLNRVCTSDYLEDAWCINKYVLNDTDYFELNRLLDENEALYKAKYE